MFDYIVVGGGSAGCVVASRLSENPDVTVLLLEEGPRDRNPYIHLPVGFYKTSQGKLVERYPWQPPADYIGAPAPSMVQARVLGGGGSVNAMVYLRGQPADFDGWAASGAAGWGYKDVLPFFKRCEHNNRFCNEVHGIDGPLGVSDQDHTHQLTRIWLQACQQAGLPYNADFNSGVQDGCGLYQINTRNGRRSSTSVAYLGPARRRKNLTVKTGCRVLRLLIENHRAVGVDYIEGKHRKTVRAGREIVISAGSINSPKLLMLSGLGPADHLAEMGIPVIQDLPGVGQNLQDHIEVSLINELHGSFSYDKYKRLHWRLIAGLQYAMFRSGPVASNIVEGGAFWRSSLAEGRPDAQYCFLPGAGVEEGVDTVPGGSGCTLNVCQTRPKSVGFLKLTSADPLALPYIQPNYLQQEFDLDCMAEAVEFGRAIMAQPVMAKYVKREYRPDRPLRTRADYRAFVRREAHAALHPVGTCRMGVDAMAVVDPDLRVHGVAGLRVADNSIAPSLSSSNTHAIAVMIGEKAADHIGRGG